MKQVIVVNEALRLPRGKLAAQVAHAAVDAFLDATRPAQEQWLAEGMPKIVVQCDSETQLNDLADRAREAGLPTAVIADAGHTVLVPGTITCLGVGPAADDAVDEITGELKLVR
jgi:PTH2 family peptidyl-tRNA hydrolase